MKLDTKTLTANTVNGLVIAGAFVVLSILVNILNGIIAFGVPIWTIIAAVIVLPLAGITTKILSMQNLLGMALSVAIVGIIAAFIPAAQFLFAPFTASITGLVGLIAVLLHLGAAVSLREKVKQMAKI